MRLFAVVSLAVLLLLVFLAGCSGSDAAQDSGLSAAPEEAASEDAIQDGKAAEDDVDENQDTLNIFEEVWSSNGFDGQTFEFKVNCAGEYDTLEECFLWDVQRVTVTGPDNHKYELNKDFNVNSYSGEITRRWVLYGPKGAGLPERGEYTFTYVAGNRIIKRTVSYEPDSIDYPKNVAWEKRGNDLHVAWDGQEAQWHKVLIFRQDAQVISQEETGDATSAVLRNVPLEEGERATLNVAAYFSGGYAYSEYHEIIW